MTDLFTPLQAGAIALANRIVMAPLTRARAGRSHIPNALMAEYYAQRASAGLIISEATMVAADGCAFTGEGGLFDEECVRGWRLVTDAVHARGGRIIVQLFHPGRAAHSVLNGGLQPVSSSDRAIRERTIRTPEGPKPYEIPRRLSTAEIPAFIALFGAAAGRAQRAGFDGVQFHGAHGYLLDQFLRDGVNDRHDEYGGSIENRSRFLLAAVDQAIAALGADRVAVRLSPLVPFNDITDSDPTALVRYLAGEFNQRGLAFLELRHGDFSAPAERAMAGTAREHFHGPLFLNGGFDGASARAAVVSGEADAVVFGQAYVSNPDLVARLARNAPLNAINNATLYSPGAVGYTDYPALPDAPSAIG